MDWLFLTFRDSREKRKWYFCFCFDLMRLTQLSPDFEKCQSWSQISKHCFLLLNESALNEKVTWKDQKVFRKVLLVQIQLISQFHFGWGYMWYVNISKIEWTTSFSYEYLAYFTFDWEKILPHMRVTRGGCVGAVKIISFPENMQSLGQKTETLSRNSGILVAILPEYWWCQYIAQL